MTNTSLLNPAFPLSFKKGNNNVGFSYTYTLSDPSQVPTCLLNDEAFEEVRGNKRNSSSSRKSANKRICRTREICHYQINGDQNESEITETDSDNSPYIAVTEAKCQVLRSVERLKNQNCQGTAIYSAVSQYSDDSGKENSDSDSVGNSVGTDIRNEHPKYVFCFNSGLHTFEDYVKQGEMYENEHENGKRKSNLYIEGNGRNYGIPSPSTPCLVDEEGKKKKKKCSYSDLDARARCFEYLISAIDEVTAMYCDCASKAEDEIYNDESYGFPNTPNSLRYSDSDSDSEDRIVPASEMPATVKLQKLKDRLTHAKYYLQEVVDSNKYIDCEKFWRRWDLVKYAVIELVEDEDDDLFVDGMVEELEKGRSFYSQD